MYRLYRMRKDYEKFTKSHLLKYKHLQIKALGFIIKVQNQKSKKQRRKENV